MMDGIRGAGLASLLLLAACAQGGPGQTASTGPATAADARYACQMRGAMAEDRVYGPFGKLDIDSALVRAQVTEDCLAGAQRAGTLPPTPKF
ncbi:hypothetical protein SAMN02745194_01914 [Roseomonas rosea]|uniref:Lipoprotein n=1 Tax=Muricoccus roseus TaxID=198092 RepID=A0A1M6H3J2_9PROT|nr:hypothetical protein [Roseomonas rosea]SHJ16768.1 hypothetical protein SAMN02745194_01914 [Roseomonas rosea]